jgi:hypothetical protein
MTTCRLASEELGQGSLTLALALRANVLPGPNDEALRFAGILHRGLAAIAIGPAEIAPQCHRLVPTHLSSPPTYYRPPKGLFSSEGGRFLEKF